MQSEKLRVREERLWELLVAWARFHSGSSGVDHFRPANGQGGLPAPPPAFADDGLDDDDDDDDDDEAESTFQRHQ